MAQRTVTIAARTGLHARPATLFVQAAAREPVPVRIATASKGPVNARSILAVLSLGAGHGAEVTLEAEGDGADEVLDRLVDLLSRDLDADEGSTTPTGATVIAGSAPTSAPDASKQPAGEAPAVAGAETRT